MMNPEMMMQPQTDVDAEEDAPNVDPEEQEQYDRIVMNAMKVIHGQNSRDAILQSISTGNPAEAIGQLAGQLVAQINQSAMGAGAQLSEDAMYHAGIEIIEQLTELAISSGIVPEEQADQVHAIAIESGLQTYKMMESQGNSQGMSQGQPMQPQQEAPLQKGLLAV